MTHAEGKLEPTSEELNHEDAIMAFDISTAKQTRRGTALDRNEDDLNAARGIFAGVLMGAVLWVLLIVSISLAHAELPVPPAMPAATAYGAG